MCLKKVIIKIFFEQNLLFKLPLKAKKVKSIKRYRNHGLQQRKFEDLQKSVQRFKRMYLEYELIADDLKNVETSKEVSLPDDFLEAIQLQKDFLENEIENWIKEKTINKE